MELARIFRYFHFFKYLNLFSNLEKFDRQEVAVEMKIFIQRLIVFYKPWN